MFPMFRAWTSKLACHCPLGTCQGVANSSGPCAFIHVKGRLAVSDPTASRRVKSCWLSAKIPLRSAPPPTCGGNNRSKAESVWQIFSSGSAVTLNLMSMDAPVLSQPPESSFTNLNIVAHAHQYRQDELRTPQPPSYAAGSRQQDRSCPPKMGRGGIQGHPRLC